MSNETQIKDEMLVWITWANTDTTEGRGTEYPICVSTSRATAIRKGRKGYVMGTDCPVSEGKAYLIEGRWCAPVHIEGPNQQDAAQDKIMTVHDEAVAKAKAAGLSEDDIQAIIRNS